MCGPWRHGFAELHGVDLALLHVLAAHDFGLPFLVLVDLYHLGGTNLLLHSELEVDDARHPLLVGVNPAGLLSCSAKVTHLDKEPVDWLSHRVLHELEEELESWMVLHQ